MRPSVADVRASGNLSVARWLFWLTFFLYILSQIAARAWDSYWHTTHTFDGFFSPPHVFIYVTTTVTCLLIELVIFMPDLRGWFGPGFRIPLLPFEVPAALALVGGGYLLMGFAGLVLDNAWHSNFGLDETMWSLPHAMLGWTAFVSLLGFIACALVLHRHRPFSQFVTLLLGFFLLGLSVSTVLGPFYENSTPGTVQAIANLPVFRIQPEAQHTFQIFLDWHLDRTNPLLAPLGALWAGSALAFLRQLDGRSRVVLAASFLWTLITLLGDYGTALRLATVSPNLSAAHDPTSWLPLPILPAAIIFLVLTEVRLTERWAWMMAGWVFGALVFLCWGMQPVTAVLAIGAGPTMAAGALLGERIYHMVEAPDRVGVVKLLVASVGLPIVLGCVDLYLRAVTPR